MSNCLHCGLRRDPTEGDAEPAQACRQCGVSTHFFGGRDASFATTVVDRAGARVSAVWILMILLVTCCLSLLSIYHPEAKQGPFLVFSKLMPEVAARPNQ
jgi:hypothetical protein